MATSTLRAIVLAAAVILGVVGLTKAFPSGTSPVTPTGGGAAGSPSVSASPSTPVSPTPSATPRAPGEVVVQVLNGSGVTGLAASKTNKLKKADYKTKEPGDWPNHINTTIVYYKAGFQVDAEFIQDRFFPTATVKPVAQAATANADVTIVLGESESSSSPSG